MAKAKTTHPLIAQLLRARTQRGITQGALADQVFTSTQSVHCWEAGKTDPRLSSIAAYADALGYDIVLAPKRRWLR